MDCNKCIENISPYIDNELSESERIGFEKHIKECEECRLIYQQTLNITKDLRSMEEEKLPDDYQITLREKLEKEKELINPSRFNKKWIGLGAIAVIFIMIVIGPGLQYIKLGNMSSDSAMEESVDMDRGNYDKSIETEMTRNESAESVEFDDEASEDIAKEGNLSLEGRKIIKNVHIDIEMTDFDKSYKEIIEYVNSSGGYIQNSNINTNNRNGKDYKEVYVVLRIPQRNLDNAINHISEKGKVNNVSINSDDITKQYMDNEARLKNLEVQEERLRELINKAEKIEDILIIENELRRVRTEIEQIESILKNWDNLVSLSTIDLRIIEVESIGNQINPGSNIFDRSKEGFISTINIIIKVIQSIFVFIVTILPVLLILGLVVVIYILYRRRIK